MKLRGDIQKGIVAAIVASILFVWLLQPLGSLLGRIILAITRHLYSAYTDRLFAQVALGVPPDFSFHLLLAVYVLSLGVLVGFCVFIFTTKGGNAILKAGGPRVVSRGFKIFLATALVIFTATISLGLWSAWFQLRTTTSFQQHMAAIAPYISDQEAKTLRSRWTQMRGEKDYLEIYRDVQAIAAAHKVRLPPNPVYSLKAL